jgi:hypothetical protein
MPERSGFRAGCDLKEVMHQQIREDDRLDTDLFVLSGQFIQRAEPP